MSDAIKAALREAWKAECMARCVVNDMERDACSRPCRWCSAGSVAAVAAFLRALPETAVIPGADQTCPSWKWERFISRDLAAAVERAAREGGE